MSEMFIWYSLIQLYRAWRMWMAVGNVQIYSFFILLGTSNGSKTTLIISDGRLTGVMVQAGVEAAFRAGATLSIKST